MILGIMYWQDEEEGVTSRTIDNIDVAPSDLCYLFNINRTYLNLQNYFKKYSFAISLSIGISWYTMQAYLSANDRTFL
jgi:hypothetical protein